MSLEPKIRLGHYEIRAPLATGGMGEIYLAQDTSELDRKVAIKVLPTELSSDPNRMQRFIQEARTVSALNHPNILTIYEFGQEGPTRFIAMEYVDGVTLREYLSQKENRARRDVPVALHLTRLHDVLEVGIQVAAALDAAHEVKVIHRDMSSTVILSPRTS
jgi:eukaryotic-like serine/threonine-protein kinase